MKTQLIDNLPGILIIIPILTTIVLYQLSYRISKRRWIAVHLSVQWSTVFYIIAVTILLERLIHQNIIGYIIIGLLLLLSAILIVQRKKKTEVVLRDGLKVLSRISFLIFSSTYIVLISYELIQLI